MISSEALGRDGREVRCGKCGHMWFQQAETDSLDELVDVSPSHEEGDLPIAPWKDPFANEIDFTLHKENEQVRGVKEDPKPKAKVESDPNLQVDLRDRKPIISRAKQKHIAAVMVALAIVSALLCILVLGRDSLGRNIPFLGAAYAKMGFDLTQEEPKITFDRIRLSREEKNISGTGSVINLTERKIAVDKIVVDLLDSHGKVLKTTDIKVEGNALEAESSQKINFALPDMPKEAVSVRLSIKD